MALVKDNGPKKWSQIAAELPGKFLSMTDEQHDTVNL
jgi:hypothetical protein